MMKVKIENDTQDSNVSMESTWPFKIETNEEISIVDVAPLYVETVVPINEEVLERQLHREGELSLSSLPVTSLIKEETSVVDTQDLETEISVKEEDERHLHDEVDPTLLSLPLTSLIKEEISIVDVQDLESEISVEDERNLCDKEDHLMSSTRSKMLVNLAVFGTDEETISQLNVPTYEFKCSTPDERTKAVIGYKFQNNSRKPFAIVTPTSTPIKDYPTNNVKISTPITFRIDETDKLEANRTTNEITVETDSHGLISEDSDIDRSINSNDVNVSGEDSDLDYDPNQSPSQPTDDIYSSSSDTDTEVKISEQERTVKQGKAGQIPELSYTIKTSGIVVKTVDKADNGIVIRNKGHCCYFCDKIMVNLPKHFSSMHKEELKVAKILAFEKNSHERRKAFIELSRLGDYFHNCETLIKKEGEMIVARRPGKNEYVNPEDYGPCPECLGFFLRKHLWHHVKYACSGERTSESEEGNRRRVLAESSVLLSSSLFKELPEGFVKEIVSRLQSDSVGKICKEDLLIMRLGVMQYKKYGLTKNEMTRQYMRQLGRLLKELKRHVCTPLCNDDLQGNETKTLGYSQLREWVKPNHFDCFVVSVKKVCSEQNPQTKLASPSLKIPFLALKLGIAIKKGANILRGLALRNREKERVDELKGFINLLDLEWSFKILSNALDTTYKKKFNNPKLLPITEDLVKLNEFLMREIEVALDDPITNWRRLAETTLSKLVLFNKTRSGEAAKMTIDSFIVRPKQNNVATKELLASLSQLEKKLSNRLDVIEIVGKRGKKVPVLLTKDLVKNINVLIKNREKAGIAKDNPYIFARANGSSEHLRGHDCISKLAAEANLLAPHLVTSTNLRKYIATVVQIFNLSENETDWLARHLGHDIIVHREFYRTHKSTVETTKISGILLAIEQRKAHMFAGKKLDDINVDCLNFTDDEVASGGEPAALRCPSSNRPDTDSDVEPEQSTPQKRKIKRKKVIQDADSEAEGALRFPSLNRLDTDSDVEPKQSTPQKRKIKRKKAEKRPWSGEEIEAIMKFFDRKYIGLGEVPGKEKCQECINQSERVLQKRSWKDVKYYVYNSLKKLKLK